MELGDEHLNNYESGDFSGTVDGDILEIIDLPDNSNEDGMEDIDISDEQDGLNEPVDLDNVWGMFSKHEGCIFTIGLNPSATLAVSGGEDDKAFVWSISDGKSVIECDGHKDSVTCVGFSHDGHYVATADMSGLIIVWKVESKKQIWCFEVSEIEWLRWHDKSHVLFAGTLDGDTWLWNIPRGECKTLQGFGVKSTTALLLPCGMRGVVAYANGSIKIWDVKAASAVFTIENENPQDDGPCAVLCLDHSNNVIIAGFEDGLAKLINTVTGKVIGILNCKIAASEDSSVEGVGFCRSQPLAATATLGGTIFIWDVATQICRHQFQQDGQIVKLIWAPASPTLYTASLDGYVRLWDARAGQMEKQWRIHKLGIMDFDLSRDGSILVTCSEDGTASVLMLNQ